MPSPEDPDYRRRIARMNRSIRITTRVLEYWRNRAVRPGQPPLSRETVGETSVEYSGHDLAGVRAGEVDIFPSQTASTPFFSGGSSPIPRIRRPLSPQEEEAEITSVAKGDGDSWTEIMDKVRQGPIEKHRRKVT